jgi:hypothetical protein
MTMKKLKRYAPWLIAGGAIVFAVATHRFYAGKLLLELPSYQFNGMTHFVLPTVDKPITFVLKNGEKLALFAVEATEAAITAVV